jgi:PAS domain S-box-containing protein
MGRAMKHTVFPPREAERLAELYRYGVLDTAPEKALDDLVQLAAYICQSPIAVVSLVDADRQWFKSKIGLTETQTSRIIAFCAHTILGDELFVVPDASVDDRFTDNPLVTGDPHIRFYCGAPLTTPDGHHIGTLGVIDRVPRELSQEQLEAMRVLSHQVMDHLNLDRRHKELLTAVGERLKAEDALKASEERFALAAEGTEAGIWDWDLLTGRVYYSPRWKSMLGYDQQDLPDVFTTWETLLHPEDREQAVGMLRAYQTGKTARYEAEHRLRHKDGSYRWILARGALLRDASGRPYRMAGSHLDVTERKQAENLKTVERQALEQVSQNKPLPETMEFLVRSIEALSHGAVCSILLVGPDGRTLHRGAVPTLPERFSRAVDGAPIGPQNGSCGTAAYRKAPVIVTDIATDPLWAPWTEAKDLALQHGLKACTSIPIIGAAGDVLGTYAMYYRMTRGPTDFELDLLRASSHLLTIAIERARNTEAVKASEARLEAILDNSPLLIFLKDRAGHYLITNREFSRRFEWPRGYAIGKTDSDLFPLEQARAFLANDQEVLRTGMPIQCEEVVRLPEGERTSLVAKFPLRDPQGEIYAVGGIVADITEQKRAQEEARRWQQVFERAQSALAYANVADNRFVAVNEAFAKERGYTAEELIGQPLLSVYAPEAHEAQRARISVIDQVGHLVYESVHQRKDGTTFPVLMEVTVIKDAGGDPVSRVAYALDITERKRTQDQLRLSEERFRLVSEVTKDVLWDWDLTTDSHWWSPNAQDKFGYDPAKEPSITAWRSRLHPDDRERVLHHVDECLQSGERMFVDEYQFRLADGAYGTFIDKGQMVRDAEGKPIRMIGTMIDVTASRQAYTSLEQAYTRLQRLSRELQVVEEKERRRLSRELHDEFGQLLSALKLSLARIREETGKLPGLKKTVLKKNVTVATKAVERLFASLREMVHGLRPAILDELGLVAALESMAEDIREGTGIDCGLSVEPMNVDSMIAQELMGTLFRIAQELVTNVVRHAKATRADITLRCAEGKITLVVRDNGRGRRLTELKKGYGLRGIHERVELLGGRVEMQSEHRKGTTVTVTVPVELQRRPPGPADSPEHVIAGAELKRRRHEKNM